MTQPLLCEGELSLADLGRYERDLGALAQVLAVIPKRGPRSYVGEGDLELGAGIEALRRGALRGLQVRYVHAGREWWDTLIQATPEVIRLVRIDHGEVVRPPA